MSKFQYAINTRIIGKADPHKLSYAGAWTDTQGTWEDLAEHIGAGHPWMPALLNGNRKRWQSNANYAEILALDIDGGMTKAEALEHPLIREWCGLGIETASSTKWNNKFRLIARLSEPLDNAADIKLCNQYFAYRVGHADPACKDASRFFYGAPGRTPFLLNPDATLPEDFLVQAREWQAENDRRKDEEKRRIAEARLAKYQHRLEQGAADPSALIEQANQRLGADAFLPYLEYQERGGRIRCKPAFRVGSGSYSAFLGEVNGTTLYSDPTGGHSCDGFTFYVWQQKGEGYKARGSEFWQLLREYCGIAGVTVPEFTERRQRVSQVQSLEDSASPSTPLEYIEFLQEKARQYANSFKEMVLAGHIVEIPNVIRWTDGDPVPLPEYFQDEPPRIEYKRGSNVAELAAKLRDAGWMSAVDVSFTGEGKSHRAGVLSFSGTTWYIDTNHNNPSVATVEESFENLMPRHTGLWRNLAGNLTRKELLGSPPEMPSNCPSANLFPLLKGKNYEDGKNNPICKACPHFAECGVDTRFFKAQRRSSLSSHSIRADIHSLPSSEERDYSQDTAIIEEATLTARGCLSRTTSEFKDLLLLLNKIKRANPELYKQLEPLEVSIAKLIESPQGRFGLSHEEVECALPVLENIEEILEAVKNIITPDLTLEKSDSVTGLTRDLARVSKDYFASQQLAQQEEFLRGLPVNILIPVLEVMQSKKGALSIKGSTITVTQADKRKQSTIQSFGFRLFLDATGNLRAIEAGFGLPKQSTITIAQEMPRLDNLTVYQTEMSGIKSRDLSESARRRMTEYVSQSGTRNPGQKVIGHKGMTGIDGYWGNHNRGTNTFKGDLYLLFVGLFQPNVGAIQAEHRAFFGTLEGFDDYYKSLVEDEVIQGVGRPRAQHFPGKQFFIDMLVPEGFDLAFLNKRFGIKVIKRSAVSVCLEAGTTAEKIQTGIFQLAQSIGSNVNQEGYATALGISQQAFSKHVKAIYGNWFKLKNKIQLFLNSLIGEVVKPAAWMDADAANYLIAGIVEAFSLGDDDPFGAIWEEIPLMQQAFYLGQLLALL